MQNQAGIYKNNLHGEMAYKSFVPTPLPPNPPIMITDDLIGILIKANKQIAVLNEISAKIPDLDLFISMYVRKEALMSSQIEGTQVTLEDVLNPNLEENTNKPVGDVINYIKAMHYAINRLKELPLCNRLIKETHKVLLSGVRGQNKAPGDFRHSQNWIGAAGCNLQEARYVPPSVEDMKKSMSDLEKYINSDNNTDILIQAGLIHYQFETIHPFLDGNGRIGRLLIILFLIEKKVLNTPVLYISYFLKKNRIEYYDRMNEVRAKGNYEQWIKFFLEAVYESAYDAAQTIDKLTSLHNKNISLIKNSYKNSKNTLQIFKYLEASPIIEIQKTAKELNLSFNTVSKAVKNLLGIEVLEQVSNKSRNRIFQYKEYLDILKKGT